MAKKNSVKQGKDFFDTRSGRVLADLNFADHRTSANSKSEIAFIREAFPLRSKDDITLVLQSCDYNVEAAIACFTNGEADNLLKEWNTQGRKSKNGNSAAKKKRNKKKQAKNGDSDSCQAEAAPQKSEQNDSQPNQNGCEDASVRSEDDPKKPIAMSSLTLDCPSSSMNLLHPPSPSSSEMSLPSSNSDQPADAIQDPEHLSKDSSDSPSHSPPTHTKFERMMSTGPDALKKTVKDLQRSSVSLPRFQLLLEEECEKSFKSIAETFKELQQCLKDREAELLAQMEEFKKQAVELLEQRQENAAALKLKSERVGGMLEAEVTQLRNEIKNFVTERKIDEELARTTRFVGDKDKLLSMVKSFGGVVPIKSCYSPVMLNPPTLPTKKVEGSNQDKKVTEPVKPVTSSASSSAAVPAITVPTDDNSVSSHKALQEVAELHAKLQAALQQQGLSSSTGKHTEGHKQSRPENKKDRPKSTTQAPPQEQSSTRRPQTAHPQNQQKKEQNPQHEKSRQTRSAEQRGSQQERRQGSNQSYRNSRRSNQRQPPPPRKTRPESTNEKKGVPREEATQSGNTQQQPKPDEEKQLQSNAEKVKSQQSESGGKKEVPKEEAGAAGKTQEMPKPDEEKQLQSNVEKVKPLQSEFGDKKEVPKEEAGASGKAQQMPKPDEEKQPQSDVQKDKPQQSESGNKEHAQQGNRNRQVREERDGGDERPRNRNRRRRGGRRGATEGQNERDYLKGTGEKSENGPLDRGPSEKGPVEKSPLLDDEKKTTVKEEVDHNVKMSAISAKKDNVPAVERNNEASKSQNGALTNGKKTDTGSNSSELLNGEKAHEGESVTKEALPQRPDRPSRRRGAQRDRKDGPSSRPAPKKDLSGTKPVENGVGDYHTEESAVQSEAKRSDESSHNVKLPAVEKDTKIGSYIAPEHEKDFDKAHVPKVNGYIPVKELNEVTIGR